MNGFQLKDNREALKLSVEDLSKRLKRCVPIIKYWESIKTDSIPSDVERFMSAQKLPAGFHFLDNVNSRSIDCAAK